MWVCDGVVEERLKREGVSFFISFLIESHQFVIII